MKRAVSAAVQFEEDVKRMDGVIGVTPRVN
jgi:hypothetical protein